MFKEFARVDVLGKVTGTARYAEDIRFPDMVYGTMVRSTVAHGRILEIDASEALAMEGVLGVLTAKDIPGSPGKPKERPVLVPEIVRFIGDGVALVVWARLSGPRAARVVPVRVQPTRRRLSERAAGL